MFTNFIDIFGTLSIFDRILSIFSFALIPVYVCVIIAMMFSTPTVGAGDLDIMAHLMFGIGFCVAGHYAILGSTLVFREVKGFLSAQLGR